MARLKAANSRTAEGDAAMQQGDYNAAARAYTQAAEQLESAWWEMHRERGTSNDAVNMRRAARDAISRRDKQA